MQKNFNSLKLLQYFLSIIAAGFSVGFGILNGFLLTLAALIRRPNLEGKRDVIFSGISASAIISAGVLIFSGREITQNGLLDLSIVRIFNIIYFIAAGISQAIISRFFLPDFIPNIYSPVNIAVMIALPAIVLAFFTWVIIKNIKNYSGLAPLFLFGGYTVIPYSIASLARSGPEALGGIAERYIYLPFFFFILTLIYALHLASRRHKFPAYLTKLILPGAVAILSIGQQIVMHLEVSRLFLR